MTHCSDSGVTHCVITHATCVLLEGHMLALFSTELGARVTYCRDMPVTPRVDWGTGCFYDALLS